MVSPIVFLKQVWEELQKVTFPTSSEVTRLTIVVILLSVIVGLYIGALDFVFTKTIEILVK